MVREGGREGGREGKREQQRQRQRGTETERDREKQRDTERERESLPNGLYHLVPVSASPHHAEVTCRENQELSIVQSNGYLGAIGREIRRSGGLVQLPHIDTHLETDTGRRR